MVDDDPEEGGGEGSVEIIDPAADQAEREARKDKSIRKIQNAFRARRGRMLLREMIRENYVKIFDKINNQYAYKNRTTGDVTYTKPVFLGEQDLPTPRIFNAPQDYESGAEYDDCSSYALIVTVSTFAHDKITPLAKGVDVDHFHLNDLATHDFIGKFRPENVFALKNPTCASFAACMEKLGRLCKKDGFLFVYLCTHVVICNGGEDKKDNETENTYFCMEDTLWKEPKTIAMSSISLGKMIIYLNRISSVRKTIFINYAHRKIFKKTLFGKTKGIYPPPTFLYRLANEVYCAVIGCCTIGMPLAETIQHSPAILEGSPEEVSNQLVKLGREQHVRFGELYNSTDATPDRNMQEVEEVFEDDVENGNNFFEENVVKVEVLTAGQKRARMKQKFKDDWTRIYRDLWQIPPDKGKLRQPPPDEPMPTWEKTAETQDEYEITVPTRQEVNRHFRQMIFWGIRSNVFEPIANRVLEAYRYFKLHSITAPPQMSLTGEKFSLFGGACVAALNGGASDPASPIVSAATFYEYIRKHMYLACDELALDPETKLQPYQCPVLIIPLNGKDCSHNPVCYRCGPPAAPERPFIVNVGNSEVTLEWYDPPFDGVAPEKYRVYMRNVSRCYNDWNPIAYNGDITTTKYKIRDLPTGVYCQFKVVGYNSGGWGLHSEETIMVCPGEELNPLGYGIKWKRLAMGGPLSVVDRMNVYPKHRHEALKGMEMLIAFGQQKHGFQKGLIQLRVAAVALQALNTFPNDRDVCGGAFLLLSYAMRGPKDRKVRLFLNNNGITALAERYMERFRIDSKVIGGISQLRSVMTTKFIPRHKDLVHEEPVVEVESSDSDTDSEDDVANPNPATSATPATASRKPTIIAKMTDTNNMKVAVGGKPTVSFKAPL